ncbi:GntR family transcriptional regulator [Thermophilibacter sp.]
MAQTNPAPKYFLIERAIIERIERREYRENEPIPSERELMESFGVSRITVRRAIDELVHDGHLYKVQGKGTFVKGEEYDQSLLSITSCTQDVINHGMTPRREVISAEVMEATGTPCSALELGRGEEVFRLERIYYADDTPINHTVTYLPYRLFFGIDLCDFSQESLYEVLRKEYHAKLLNATRTVEAALARGKTADYLHVRPGIPLLYFTCVTQGEVRGKRQPIEYFNCWYRSDKFKFYINQVSG